MIVVWGKRVRRRPAGMAAAFCPVCREVTEASVRDVQQYDHLYLIPMRGTEHLADELTCAGCGLVSGFDPGKVRPAPSRDGDLIEMAVRTGPMDEEGLGRRLALEARASTGTMTAEERIDLILEAILAMEYGYVAAQAKGLRTSISAVLQFLLFVGIFASVIVGYTWMYPTVQNGRIATVWPASILGATILLLVVVLYRMLADRRAAARGHLGLLGRSLAPLRPQPHELDEALLCLRRSKREIAQHLSIEQLIAAVQRG